MSADRAKELRAELLRRELARRQSSPSPVVEPSHESSPQAPAQPVPLAQSAAWGTAQGLTADHADEIYGAAKSTGFSLGDIARRFLSPPAGPAGFQDVDLEARLPTDELPTYEQARNEARAMDEAAKTNKKTYYGTNIAGAVMASALPIGVAAKGAKGLGLVKAGLKGGAVAGAVAGEGASKAELLNGDVAGVAKDTATGAVVGGAVGAVAAPLANLAAKGVAKIGDSLVEFGRARLFKAAVGQNKRAFTQLNGKGLLDKSGEYLDDLGIGLGDTTESIYGKLDSRSQSLRSALGSTVEHLDQATSGAPLVSPAAVADKIEKQVAQRLKPLAAARGDYKAVMDEVAAIREIEGKISFGDAARQRAAMQDQINYDSANKRDVLASARREMARIWNEEIDNQAEAVLRGQGRAPDAYRELRREYALVEDLLKHVRSRVEGNQSIKWLKPSDMGAGGIAGIMTGNPAVGLAAAVGNHLGLEYGNAAAGRAAIGMARMATSGAKGAERLLPASLARTAPGVAESRTGGVLVPAAAVADEELPLEPIPNTYADRRSRRERGQ